ncbi:MAG: HU family DNA-binding protein, partial [Roseobacter sp.]
MSTKKTPIRNQGTTAGKRAAPVKATTPIVSDPLADSEKKDLLRKRELVERVALRAGVKKKDAKPIVEVMLAELGEALAAGRSCALPPLG